MSENYTEPANQMYFGPTSYRKTTSSFPSNSIRLLINSKNSIQEEIRLRIQAGNISVFAKKKNY